MKELIKKLTERRTFNYLYKQAIIRSLINKKIPMKKAKSVYKLQKKAEKLGVDTYFKIK